MSLPPLGVVEVLGAGLGVEARERIGVLHLVVVVQRVVEGVVVAAHVEIGVARGVEQRPGVEPLGEEVEPLPELHLRHEVHAAVLLVAFHHVGIGVEVVALAGVAEEDVVDLRLLGPLIVVFGEEHGLATSAFLYKVLPPSIGPE